MKNESLKIIEEVTTNFAKLSLIQITKDKITLKFIDVELGVPKNDNELSLTIEFAKNPFLTVFYDNIWNIEFLSEFNYNKHHLDKSMGLKIEKIKFSDFEYLNTYFHDYSRQKNYTLEKEFDIHNIRNDYFCLIEFNEIAMVIGGNELKLKTGTKEIDDDELKELSNQWMLYYLKYHQKRNILKDPMCEKHPFNNEKK